MEESAEMGGDRKIQTYARLIIMNWSTKPGELWATQTNSILHMINVFNAYYSPRREPLHFRAETQK